MTLSEYLADVLPTIAPQMHVHTVYEYGRAVRSFCGWLDRDPDLSEVTPELVDEFEHESGVTSCRKLAGNLRSLMQTHDAEAWTRKRRYEAVPTVKFSEVVTAPKATAEARTAVEFAAWYTSVRDVSTDYADTLRTRAAKLQAFAGEPEIAKVFCEQVVNAYLHTLTCSPFTVRKYRQDFLALWRAAADEDLAPYPVTRRIRQPKCPPQLIECYSPEEAGKLLAAATAMKGGMADGRSRRCYWVAIIRLAWETGLRRGDLWRIERKMIRPDNTFAIVQHKTAKPIVCRIRPQTVQAIEAAGGYLAWPHCPRSFTYAWERLVKSSGVNRGVFKYLRRGSGSIVESMMPGAGCKLLGNTEQVFRANYDAKLRPVDLPMPPELDADAKGGAA